MNEMLQTPLPWHGAGYGKSNLEKNGTYRFLFF
jgi:hypothetical protein